MASVLTDGFLVGALIKSIGLPLDAYLRTWVVGALALSLPATYLVHQVKEKFGIRAAFVCDALAFAAAFSWLAFGTVLVAQHPGAAAQAPWLFWPVWFFCVGGWIT